MPKKLYQYKGPIYNGDIIFKSIDEYVYAFSPSQALKLISTRVKYEYGQELWLKPEHLTVDS